MSTWSDAQTEWIIIHSADTSNFRLFEQFQAAFPGASHTYDAFGSKFRRIRRGVATPTPVASDAEVWMREVLAKAQALPPTEVPPSSGAPALVLLLSDLHVGKTSSSFNLAVAAERIASIPTQLAAQHTGELSEIVVILDGDIVEGEDIFPTQHAIIECDVLTQAQKATEMLWGMLGHLQAYAPRVRVVTAPGNHGRMSKTATPKSNWDNVVYAQLQLLNDTHGGDDLIVTPNYSDFTSVAINGTIGLINHHGTKHLGTPAMQRKWQGWQTMFAFDWAVHGHWHHPAVNMWQGRWIMSNGSLCGPDDFSMQIGAYSPAAQGWFVLNSEGDPSSFGFLEW